MEAMYAQSMSAVDECNAQSMSAQTMLKANAAVFVFSLGQLIPGYERPQAKGKTMRNLQTRGTKAQGQPRAQQ